MLWMGWGQFHVAFYMFSTLGGTVNQSNQSKAGNKLYGLKKKQKKTFQFQRYILSYM